MNAEDLERRAAKSRERDEVERRQAIARNFFGVYNRADRRALKKKYAKKGKGYTKPGKKNGGDA